MKNSISSDVLVGRLSELCENQSVIISGIGKLLSLLSENNGSTLVSENVHEEKISVREADTSIEQIETISDAPKKRGRPAKSTGLEVAKKGRSAKASDNKSDDINSMKFSEVLLHIAKISKKPMKVAGFVETALKLGYKSDAKDFANITYQYLHSMSKKGKINKNENNEYFN